MPTVKDSLKDRLARYRQITLTVTGRQSGRKISRPVWFVLEGSDTLWLLPVQGSDTQWYKNVLHNRKIRISARGEEGEFQATPLTDAKSVKAVVEAFRAKYGIEDVKKYYAKFDVAVRIDLSRAQRTA
jgi:deazaflavin-dependent oxidoreductase (nitroreductase family)